jgi:hypothetical protein
MITCARASNEVENELIVYGWQKAAPIQWGGL